MSIVETDSNTYTHVIYTNNPLNGLMEPMFGDGTIEMNNASTITFL